MSIEEFIIAHRSEDVRTLALKGRLFPGIDMPYALDQIAGWQIARHKIPSWARQDGIIYPPHLSMEQCSSETTALYKRKVLEQFLCSQHIKMDGFTDITGGFGVDFSFIAPAFQKAVYVEQQQHLCEAVRKNLNVLNLKHAEVNCADGTVFLRSMTPCTAIYLDPARRNDYGGRTYAIEDCTPNVIELADLLLEKSEVVMVKLSPMLDWHKAVKSLKNVCEVHIVSTGGECKELLLVMSKNPRLKELRVVCVNDDETFEYGINEDSDRAPVLSSSVVGYCSSDGRLFLYEPNASIMKAGCFGELCKTYPLQKIGKNSNLFVSFDEIVNFPGRAFEILSVSTMNKKDLKNALSGIKQANVAVRNFPLTAEQLRQKLKLKNGGSTYVFGTTSNDVHIILIGRRF